MKPSIRKVKSADGTRIAYATIGSGPPLVKTATYLTHLEHDWSNPIWRPLLEEMARHHQLYHYDERGCGLSDWYCSDYSWESWILDLKAVVDAEGLDKFVLFGQSQGSTVATAFAARYPERVEKLIILNGYVRGWLKRDLTEQDKKLEKLIIDLMKIGLGKENPAFRNFFCGQIMPAAGKDKVSVFNELMRVSTEPEIAAKLEQHMHLTNVEEEAVKVQCPALICHSHEDVSVPFSEGRYLAELIPNARFVRLDTPNHILQENEKAWYVFWKEVYEFLGMESAGPNIDNEIEDRYNRELRVILFTDIVDSTKHALEKGDKEWIRLLEVHSEITYTALNQHQGELIKDTGDGFMVLFKSPTNAIYCARQIIKSLKDLPIQIRCGMHAGEIERRKGDIRGINVHIASRVMGQAGQNEIWLTSIVKDLVRGSDFKFEKKGNFNLKSLPGENLLFCLL